jgi:deoxyribodipyrimidine photo-lyase
MGIQVVWFKRDLRIHDHKPLAEAAERGDVVCLYVYEPQLIESPEFDASHQVFIDQSLDELEDALDERGAHMTYRVGHPVEVFDTLHKDHDIDHIWSHMETGNALTFERDEAVRAWCRNHGVQWDEPRQFGVIRGLKDRDGWAEKWDEQMSQPIIDAPESIDVASEVEPGERRSLDDLGLPPSEKDEAMPGGRRWAEYVLDSFLDYRGHSYQTDMSSPVTAWDGCSRLSPYIAWGNISMKEIYQRTQARITDLRRREDAGEDIDGRWFRSLSAFNGRLHWHCHFMQKLEMEPSMEFRNLARSYDGLREDEFDEDKFEAWKAGQTGFPMVDACMRALHRAGWINFRMRAMLVSFASYHLWLHWRRPSVYLAKHFLDFEPGIHFPQFQMQSGVTGINSIRIYSPTKQVEDHDPDGDFIREYVPELKDVPSDYIAEPSTMPKELQEEIGCVIGEDYPEPIVGHPEMYHEARSRIWSVKGTDEAKAEAEKIYQKHGSRRRG